MVIEIETILIINFALLLLIFLTKIRQNPQCLREPAFRHLMSGYELNNRNLVI